MHAQVCWFLVRRNASLEYGPGRCGTHTYKIELFCLVHELFIPLSTAAETAETNGSTERDGSCINWSTSTFIVYLTSPYTIHRFA